MSDAQIALPIVRKMIRHLKENGFTCKWVDDGEEKHMPLGERAIMRSIEAVDLSYVRFENESEGGTVMLILCNAEDVISDWSYTENGKFSAVMDAFIDTLE